MWPRVYDNKHFRLGTPSLHSSKVHRRHKTEGTAAKNGTNDPQYSMDTYRGVSGQAVVTKLLDMLLNQRHHLSEIFKGGAISSWSKFFSIQFYVETRCLLFYVSKPILPISALQSTQMNGLRRDQ